MARQRTSPYLSGVRSRLWRFVPASPRATKAQVRAEAASGAIDAVLGGPANGPVIALNSAPAAARGRLATGGQEGRIAARGKALPMSTEQNVSLVRRYFADC